MLNKLLEAAMVSDVSGKDQVRICMESFGEAVAAERDSTATLCSTAAVVDGIKEAATGNPEVAEAAEELFRQVALANGVSTEGLISDLISKFRKGAASGKPGLHVDKYAEFGPDYKKHKKNLYDAIDKFYLNDKWLGEQTLVTDKISVKDIAGTLSVDGKLSDYPIETIELGYKNIEKFVEQWAAVLNETREAYSAIDVKLRKDIAALNINVDKLTSATYGEFNERVTDLLEAAIKAQRTIKDPCDKLPSMSGTGFGNTAIVRNKRFSIVDVEVRGPLASNATVSALNKEQIKVAAMLMKKLLTLEEPMEDLWTGDWGDYEDDSDFNDILEFYDNARFHEYYVVWGFDGGEIAWTHIVWSLVDSCQIASCLERLISRSIK